ncbi:hypothetical protein K438DRAFT_1775271 [Mycena galopus ATCC 62051]|nr:hypothetical protein K438DRAFT_1775271 [Mycena galopus ATCC 62051]
MYTSQSELRQEDRPPSMSNFRNVLVALFVPGLHHEDNMRPRNAHRKLRDLVVVVLVNTTLVKLQILIATSVYSAKRHSRQCEVLDNSPNDTQYSLVNPKVRNFRCLTCHEGAYCPIGIQKMLLSDGTDIFRVRKDVVYRSRQRLLFYLSDSDKHLKPQSALKLKAADDAAGFGDSSTRRSWHMN